MIFFSRISLLMSGFRTHSGDRSEGNIILNILDDNGPRIKIDHHFLRPE